jgi:hypothetical protein
MAALHFLPRTETADTRELTRPRAPASLERPQVRMEAPEQKTIQGLSELQALL